MNMHDDGISTGGLPQPVERRIETEKRGMEYAAFLSQGKTDSGESIAHTECGDQDVNDTSYCYKNSLPFTHKNMVDLIHAYNAALWIEDFFLTATNMTPDIPLLQNLRHLSYHERCYTNRTRNNIMAFNTRNYSHGSHSNFWA